MLFQRTGAATEKASTLPKYVTLFNQRSLNALTAQAETIGGKLTLNS